MTTTDCQDVVELVTDHLEEALSPEDRRGFLAHLQECEGCALYLAQLRTTISALGRTAGPRALPSSAVQALVAAFRSTRPGPSAAPGHG